MYREDCSVVLEAVLEAATHYKEQWHVMQRDPVGFFGVVFVDEFSDSLDQPSQLLYWMGCDNLHKMAGRHSRSLHHFATGITAYLSSSCSPACVKRDLSNGKLKVYSNRSEFDRGGGWGEYFLSLKKDDQAEFVDWYNKKISAERL